MDKNENGFRTARGYTLENKKNGELTSAMEDYLEMINRLSETTGYTRVGILSDKLQVKPSSSSKMISKLISLNYLVNDGNGNIKLTQKGAEVSDYLIERHRIVERFLKMLGANDILQETEMIEHCISHETAKRIDILSDLIENSALWEDYKRSVRQQLPEN